jgi:hypothetical protein
VQGPVLGEAGEGLRDIGIAERADARLNLDVSTSSLANDLYVLVALHDDLQNVSSGSE